MSDEISYARVKTLVQEAEAYRSRDQRRHGREMDMIAKGMAATESVRTILDAPCGVGRASIWLAQQGYEVTGIDLGEAALDLTRRLMREAGLEATLESQDIFKLPYEDRRFDATLCFRLLHHFESAEVRSRLIGEVARVSGRYVLISRMTPLSVTSIKRRLRLWLTGKPIKQYPVSMRALDDEFAAVGFLPVTNVGRFALLSSLQLRVYSRK